MPLTFALHSIFDSIFIPFNLANSAELAKFVTIQDYTAHRGKIRALLDETGVTSGVESVTNMMKGTK